MIDPLADVPRETIDVLMQFALLVREENERQNLVASSTIDDFWNRHIVDSAQLVHLPVRPWAHWVDIGSGAGLPGLVVAIMTRRPVHLIEPRAKRATFLSTAAARLSLDNVTVAQRHARSEQVRADVISARAVASLTTLFAEAGHLAHEETTWVLPKGARWREEVAEARESWQGDFRPVPSVTSSDAAVIVATKVKRRSGS